MFVRKGFFMKAKLTAVLLCLFFVVGSSLFADVVLSDGDPDPANPTFYAWYQADSGVVKVDGTAAADGDAIFKWQNQLGDANKDLFPVGNSGVVAFHDNVINGKPALEFPNTMGLQGTEANWGEIAQPNTFFVVIRHDAIGTDFIIDGVTPTKRNIFLTHDGWWKVNGGKQVATAKAFTGEFAVHCIKIDGANSYHYINGELMAEVDAGTGWPTMGGFSLGIMWSGLGNAITGSISEVLVYDGALVDEERGALEYYLMTKYGMGPNLGAGTLVSKFDGSSATVSGDENEVTSWNDQVGDWDLQGVVDSNDTCPTLVSESFPAGDFNVIKFDGTNDFLQSVDADTNDSLAQPLTIFLVGRKHSVSGSPYWFDGVSASERLIYFTNAVDGEFLNRSFAGGYVNGLPSDVDMWQIHTIVYNGFWSSMYLDGYYQGEGSVGAAKLGGLTVGARYEKTPNHLNGEIAEILVYSGALDAVNREAVEASLFNKYGLKPTCGAAYTVILDNDLNKDCRVNLADLSLLAQDWLKCTHPADCPEYYSN